MQFITSILETKLKKVNMLQLHGLSQDKL